MGAFRGAAFLGCQSDFEGVRAAERDRFGEGFVVGNSINYRTVSFKNTLDRKPQS